MVNYRKFGEQTIDEYNQAIAIAEEVIETWGDGDEAWWKNYREHRAKGLHLWIDHPAAMTALVVIMKFNDEKAQNAS